RHFGQGFDELTFGMEQVLKACAEFPREHFSGGKSRAVAIPRRTITSLDVRESRRFDVLPIAAFIPGTARIDLAIVSFAGRIVEEFVDEFPSGWDLSDRESRFFHAFERRRE